MSAKFFEESDPAAFVKRGEPGNGRGCIKMQGEKCFVKGIRSKGMVMLR
jgi:hypothetical protein